MISNTLLLLGRRIAQERLRQNLTQLALSQRSGVAYSTLRKIEAKGVGSMADYADILAALGQLDQLAAWARAGQFAPGNAGVAEQSLALLKPRKRARTPAGSASISAPALPRIPAPTPSSAPPLSLAIEPSARAAPLRRSEQLGLDFPYDWSNPAISDTALIGKVLGRARFMDVSRICAHFGMPRVEQVAAELMIELHSGVLGAMMPGLQLGEQRVSNA